MALNLRCHRPENKEICDLVYPTQVMVVFVIMAIGLGILRFYDKKKFEEYAPIVEQCYLVYFCFTVIYRVLKYFNIL